MITRHLFWSGGWDSTFRLLYVLLVRGEAVQPHYIIRLVRKSTRKELEVQAAVRARLRAEYPDAARRLLPTKIMESSALPVDPAFYASFENLYRTKRLMALQYLEMAYYAAYLSAGQPHPPFEVGFTNDETMSATFRELFECVEIEGEAQLSLAARADDPDLAFFHAFSFPVVAYTKRQMREIACSHGFLDLLQESWFCHQPIAGRIPCGTCFPCLDARDYGMGYRLHSFSHIRYFLRKYAYLPLRHLLLSAIP